MQTLYERLLPEVKERLLGEAEKYSIVNRTIIPCLNKNLFYSDLTMTEISRLIIFSNTSTFRWDYMDLKYGEKLFIQPDTPEQDETN